VKEAHTPENKEMSEIKRKLHLDYSRNEYDNTQIWAGNMVVHHNGSVHTGHLARVFLDTSKPEPRPVVRIAVELYVRGVTDSRALGEAEVEALLWTDAGLHGFMGGDGRHYPDPGLTTFMSLMKDESGNPVRRGNNAVFISEPVEMVRTGVFNYTAFFSADGLPEDHPEKSWIAVNDIAHHRDGIIVVSPLHIKSCPSVMEISVRKYGAKINQGEFVSGRIADVTRDIENIPVDVLYLLPFFEPGTGDALTGQDVRKGELGSVYAVKDFYRLSPEICSPPGEADFKRLFDAELITERDVIDVLGEDRAEELGGIGGMKRLGGGKKIESEAGSDAAVQLAGRAELRELVRKAHAAGKKVIFDLVLMQTSRDSNLVMEHRDWYELDEEGAPKIHRIAWLVYSDVALFKLKLNKPLQDYLGAVAPYWIERFGLDGVRIDASQTIDPPFLKQIKNRINQVKPDAIVLGETLCPLEEAVDVPVDMIYSLLVDHHVNIGFASPYYDLLEKYHSMFPVGTIALAYFENHDSQRASSHWHEYFSGVLGEGSKEAKKWLRDGGRDPEPAASLMTALKNLQCTLINMLSGTVDAVNFSYAIENGTDYGERQRTDFENRTVMDFSQRERDTGALLHKSYARLHEVKKNLGPVTDGHVYYLRRNSAPGNEDRIFSLVRYNDSRRILFIANLDPLKEHAARFRLDFLELEPERLYRLSAEFDTYDRMGLDPLELPAELSGRFMSEGLAEFVVGPLQSVVISF